MPVPVLLLIGGGLAVGVGVAVVASSSSSDVRLPLKVPVLLKPGETPTGGGAAPAEKFIDPIYSCFGTGPNSALSYRYRVYDTGKEAPATIGYEYLSGVPNTAAARVAKMRAKIKSNPLPPTRNKDTIVASLRRASFQQLAELTSKIVQTFGDTKNVAKVAAQYGISPTEAKKKAEAIAKAAVTSSDQYKVLEVAARELRPVADTLITAVAQVTGGNYDPGFAAVEQLLLLAASMFPVIGAVVAAGVGLVRESIAQQAASDSAACEATVNAINDVVQQTLAFKVPVPWHATEVFSPKCPAYKAGSAHAYRETDAQRALVALLTRSFDIFSGQDRGGLSTGVGQGLTVQQQTLVKQWWTLAAALMDDPKVGEVFHAFGRDAYGGTIASDEQVMLVAAPYAASLGVDVDEFARRLWDRSKGWRGATTGIIARGYREHWSQRDRCTDEGAIRNAWWLQWAVLAGDAIALARDYKS